MKAPKKKMRDQKITKKFSIKDIKKGIKRGGEPGFSMQTGGFDYEEGDKPAPKAKAPAAKRKAPKKKK